jgi:hypothetical protein
VADIPHSCFPFTSRISTPRAPVPQRGDCTSASAFRIGPAPSSAGRRCALGEQEVRTHEWVETRLRVARASEAMPLRDRGLKRGYDPVPMALLRRGLPFVAIVVAVVLLVSDWPLGWSVWIEHPFVAAFAAGLVLLLLTGAVVDVILQRREARRWVDLGRAAAYALDQVFWLSRIAMSQLVGAGRYAGLPPEIQFHVAPARARALELLGEPSRAQQADAMPDYGEERVAAVSVDRLPVLLSDARWRDDALLALLALARAHEAVIARWISAFGALGDAEGFRRVGRSIAILDRAEVVVQQLEVIDEVDANGALSDVTAGNAVQTVVTRWEELVRAYFHEAEYWQDRHAKASGLGFGEHPVTQGRHGRAGVGRSASQSTRE